MLLVEIFVMILQKGDLERLGHLCDSCLPNGADFRLDRRSELESEDRMDIFQTLFKSSFLFREFGFEFRLSFR